MRETAEVDIHPPPIPRHAAHLLLKRPTLGTNVPGSELGGTLNGNLPAKRKHSTRWAPLAGAVKPWRISVKRARGAARETEGHEAGRPLPVDFVQLPVDNQLLGPWGHFSQFSCDFPLLTGGRLGKARLELGHLFTASTAATKFALTFNSSHGSFLVEPKQEQRYWETMLRRG